MTERRFITPVRAAALSSLLPGAGHWLQGRRRRALLLLLPTAGVAIAAVVLAARGAGYLVGLSVQTGWLWALFAVNLVVLAIRLFAVSDAFRPRARGTGTVALLTLLLFTLVPHGLIAAYSVDALDLLTSVFSDDEPLAAADTIPPDDDLFRGPVVERPNPPPAIGNTLSIIPESDLDPDLLAEAQAETSTLPVFAGQYSGFEDRITVLLAGGDAGPGRWSLRTDTMIVATIDLETNRAALFGVPRNLSSAPLPAGWDQAFHGLEDSYWEMELEKIVKAQDRACRQAMRQIEEGDPIPEECLVEPPEQPPRCNCFVDQINALYTRTQDWTTTFPEAVSPGMEALRQSLEIMLGIPIDYYVLVDMAGFVAVIDALGGVEVNVTESIHEAFSPASEGEDPVRVDVDPGRHHLDGHQALAYVRSRTDSSDYVRMARQRCMLRAIADAADPVTILASFGELADVIRASVTTNIPLSILPDLVYVVGRLDAGAIATAAFNPAYHAEAELNFLSRPIVSVSRVRATVQQVLADVAAGEPAGDPDECG